MAIKTIYDEITPYITKDGSIIRELFHPAIHGNANQSLAEAIVPPSGQTRLHFHRETEEIYHFTAGAGVMIFGDEQFAVGTGDTVCIPAGTLHSVRNNGGSELRILCICCPPYSHEDTELALTVRR